MASDPQPPCTREVEISALGEGATEPLPQIGRHVLGRTQGTSLFLLGLRSAGRRAVLVHTSTGQLARLNQLALPWAPRCPPTTRIGAITSTRKEAAVLTQIFPKPPNPSSALNQNGTVEKKLNNNVP
jgi:hypothetical protein